MKNLINPTFTTLSKSATLAINELSTALENQGKKIYRFGLGQSPFPVPEAVREALMHHARQKDYLPVQGLPALRESVCEFHRRNDALTFSPDDIIIGPGSKELMFLLNLVFAGEILLPAPCWVSYHPQARISGRPVHFIPTTFDNRWRIRPEDLNNAARRNENPKLLILNYPGNPDGLSYTSEELSALAEAARKNNILILSDEIYGLLHHRGAHVSIAQFYPEGTIVSAGLSKWCGAGGWRLGTFAFPPVLADLRKALTVIASESFTSVSAPIQFAAVSAFKQGAEIQQYLDHSRKILSLMGNTIAADLRKAGAKIHAPMGGFYLFPDFSPFRDALHEKEIYTTQELCTDLLAKSGVAALPGSAFHRPDNEFTMRLAYVNFDGSKALQYLAKNHTITRQELETLCPEPFAAAQAMIEYFNQL